MSEQILATKLYIPQPQPRVVFRPRLIERLDEGLRRRLTLVCAPAGFGKTTLLSEWIAALPQPAAWLSLDEADNAPKRFLTYLVAALRTIAPDIGEGVLGVLRSPQPPTTESVLTALINEITVVEGDFVVVLDDYHAVDAEPVDDALTFLVEHLPPRMHLVIATREDPHLPLARLRARGQLTELRAADLRFTPSEAAEFLDAVMGLSLSAEEVAALETRTEGWIAGLQMAAISMRGNQDVAGFIRSFTGSHRFVLDYLVEEVLEQQPESVQAFLLRTSILDRLCGPLCDVVTLDRSVPGQETLQYLEHANLFLVPLDDERHWYRYHHLFAELLRQRLHQSADSTTGNEGHTVDELHIRASQWYEDNGLRIEAIHHALAAEDFERASGLIELAWPEMDGRFQATTWLGWVESLPDELVRARPVLGVGYAWALLGGGELEAAADRLRDAERWLDASAVRDVRSVVVDEEQFRTLPASVAAARAYHALALGDVASAAEYARRALGLLPEEDRLQRGQAAALLGLASWTSGDLEEAHRALADAMANFRLAGNLHFAISGTYGLADIRVAQGRLREAVRTYERTSQLAGEQGEPILRGTAELYLGLGELLFEQGDEEAATRYLLRSEELGAQAALPDWPYRRCIVKARIEASRGDLDGALELLDEAERLYHRGPVPELRPIAALKTRVWLAQGRLAEARGWVQEQGLTAHDDLSYLREFEHVTLARVLLAAYKHDDRADHSMLEAVELLDRMLKAAQQGGRTGSAIEILVLQALAHEAQGSISPALAPLERALTLAEPEGYVRIFVDEGRPMARLLYEALSRGVRPEYVSQLLAALPVAEHVTPSRSRGSESDLLEPLSERELEVLQLIAEGLTNREIATRLYLSLHTVKVHARNIYGKLGIKSRTQAVARGKALGILPHT